MPNYSQGPLLCGTGASIVDTNTPWTNPQYLAQTDPRNFAECAMQADGFSQFIHGTNFGFTLPSGATVLGIQFSFTKFQNGHPKVITDSVIAAIKVAGGASNNNALPDGWPPEPTQFTYGSDTDTWGLSWVGSDVNDPGFGLAIAVQNNDDTEGAQAWVQGLFATVFFQVNTGVGSNGGVTAFERIALYPANMNIWAFDPAAGFDDPSDAGSYFWRVEELMVGRKPTISRLFVTYRDLGLVTVTFTLTGVQDDQTVVTNSATVVLGNASPTGFLMTKEVDLPLSGMNMQLSVARAAGVGPLSISKIKICGRVETDSYS